MLRACSRRPQAPAAACWVGAGPRRNWRWHEACTTGLGRRQDSVRRQRRRISAGGALARTRAPTWQQVRPHHRCCSCVAVAARACHTHGSWALACMAATAVLAEASMASARGLATETPHRAAMARPARSGKVRKPVAPELAAVISLRAIKFPGFDQSDRNAACVMSSFRVSPVPMVTRLWLARERSYVHGVHGVRGAPRRPSSERWSSVTRRAWCGTTAGT